jgi:hypothetical protein
MAAPPTVTLKDLSGEWVMLIVPCIPENNSYCITQKFSFHPGNLETGVSFQLTLVLEQSPV